MTKTVSNATRSGEVDTATAPRPEAVPAVDAADSGGPSNEPVREIGGRKDGPEPTRFGDWERNGRCVDF